MTEDWDIAETINGPRRVVASPSPKEILDLDIIESLIEKNAIVICCGGGGIPVISKDGHFVGVPAVIDKDRLSALLAIQMNVDALIISTAIDSVRTGFGSEDEQKHQKMTIEQAKTHLANGEFPDGSMGPKVTSAIEAVEALTNLKSIICQPGDAVKALRGESGTIFVK